ncbi:1-deoxy-D-xylulose-5-phosphate reductoisomerase [uncultured Jatrophihabitans sp.]|uniref:1-deoxy-D-xylulose-5-phosphate reductoisomerase n=1 Tax=uncultured Jatrophihabitans sp. TaxID=1610747 RepID=UPI0035CC6168
MTKRREIVLLGSTGSVGTQTVDVVTAAPERFRVRAIAAGGRDLGLLAEQAARLRVSEIGVALESAVDELRKRVDAVWPGDVRAPVIHAGAGATAQLARLGCDTVLNAVDGSQGLRATIAALEAGAVVALANKESLIAGGPIVTRLAGPGQLVPVDSEHSALAQCLRAGASVEVARLLVTASGGPFRGRTRSELGDVTPEQALAHPTWAMGRLVTTNSATLVNKGLEIIEAHLLFDVPYERIEAVVHPQSVIHSMVEFVDGSTIAQASPPDMRLPISLALGWPDRVAGAAPCIDWTQAHSWTFEPLDDDAFPAVALAKQVGQAGGCAPAVYNAANEELVGAFHDGRIGFLQIVDTIADVVREWLSERRQQRDDTGGGSENVCTVEQVEEAENWARARARILAG